MTGSTLILIAMLSTGAIEWQPIDADICRKVLAALESGGTVIADSIDGSHLAITQGICVEDTLAMRIELSGPSLGLCAEGTV